MMQKLIGALVSLGLAAAAFYFVLGPAVLWDLAGPADQGPVSFATLERPTTPNTFLVCPEDLCTAQIDQTSPEFACSAETLFDDAVRVMSAEGAEEVGHDTVALQTRFVVRTPIMDFPDTISIRALARGPDQSAIAVYSRSLVGIDDMGVNKMRVEGLLSALADCGKAKR